MPLHTFLLCQVCRDAQVEYNIELAFEKLQQDWEARLLQLERFPQPSPRQTARPTADTVSDHQTVTQTSCLNATYIIAGEPW